MARIVLLSGPIAVGKSTLAAGIAISTGATVVAARRVVEELCGLGEVTRIELQARGAIIDAETQGRWLGDYIAASTYPDVTIVVDSARTLEQAEYIRSQFADVVVVYLDAAADVREARYRTSGDPVKAGLEFSNAMKHPTESEVRGILSIADVLVDTTNLDPEDVLDRVLRALRPHRA